MTQNQEDRQRTIQTVQIQDTEEGFAFMSGVGMSSDNSTRRTDKLTFLLDSGATDHLINQEDAFSEVRDLPVPMKITIAKKDAAIKATKRGSINIKTDQGMLGVLESVLYSPEIPYNLLSVRRIQQAGMRVVFHENQVTTIEKGDKIIATGKSLHNLVFIDLTIKKKMCNNVNAKVNTYKLWHERLSHMGKSKFLEIRRNNLLYGSEELETINPTNEICEACIYGKQARLTFSKEKDRSHVTRPLFIIHSDVCGPITPSTIDEKRYFVTFIDEFTHYTVAYLLSQKSEVFKMFQDFVTKSEAHFNLKLAHLYCDNGREYLSNEFKSFCTERGIQYHLTVPYTPQQNSVAERMNKSLTEKARAMIHGVELGKELWGEAILTATYLLNLSPTKALSVNKTPFELWHNKRPKLNYLKVFGSTVYVHDKNRKSKFDKRSIKGILVGYEVNGYKVLNTETNKFIIARDVIFDEIDYKALRPLVQIKGIETENPDIKRQKLEIDQNSETNKIEENKINKSDIQADRVDKTSLIGETNSQVSPKKNELRRSERIKNMPTINYNEEHCSYMSAQSVVSDVPKTYEEIKHRDDRFEWEKATKDEIASLEENNTWDIVTYPVNKNIVGCKWVFVIKNDVHGNPTKYKARLVAKGFSQQYLSDYNETFAPVVRMTTFRILLAFANQNNLLIHQMDVKTAFLNGLLEEEIYMQLPEGIKTDKNRVCKLNKAMYGLKQSARCWFQHFDKVLRERHFKNSSVDHCLYFLERGHVNRNIYVILYVDDVLIITFEESTMTNFKRYLMHQFSMVYMKEAKSFLGINIERKNNIITLDQNAYLQRILKNFNMSDCNAVSTPLPVKLDYAALNSEVTCKAPCRNLIGCLMYAMLCTRPDLSIALNLLSRYQNKNNQELWQCLKRVLRYVKGSLKLELIYKRNDYKDMLVGSVDSDWAGNEIDRKSTSGFLFQLFDQNTISWNTRRQNSVATSSTEAEYMALYEGVKEACWLKSLLRSINLEISAPIVINEDNNGCIAIASNPTDHKRSKHIDVKYHFTREKIEQKIITLKYIPTGQQLADAFTKALPAVQLLKIRKQMGLEEL